MLLMRPLYAMEGKVSELPETEDDLIHRIGGGGDAPSSQPPRQQARAKLDQLLITRLTSSLGQLTTELSTARDEMRRASDTASKHTAALVRATWVLAVLTGVLAFATIWGLFKHP